MNDLKMLFSICLKYFMIEFELFGYTISFFELFCFTIFISIVCMLISVMTLRRYY